MMVARSQGRKVTSIKAGLIIAALFLSFLSFAEGVEVSSIFQKEKGEEAEFLSAKKAFSDGFYSLAEESLKNFLLAYPATEHIYEAHLLLGRSLYYQNDLKGSFNEFDIVLSVFTRPFRTLSSFVTVPNESNRGSLSSCISLL
jgi:hypothetical protein